MQAQLLNTETNQVLTLAYLPLELEIGAIEASYVPADIPRRVGAIVAWKDTKQAAAMIRLTIDGSDVRSKIQQLQNLCKPIVGKFSPPVCVLQVGAMSPISCVIVAVRPTLEMGRFNRAGDPTRAKVTIEYLPVSSEAIA